MLALAWLVALSFLCVCPFRWALGPRQVAGNRLEASFGAYSGRVLDEWVPSDDNEVEDAGAWLPDVPNVWTDDSLVREEVSSGCSGSAGETCARLWFHLVSSWLVSPLFTSVDGDTGAECCGLYCSVPGSLQTVQRAEI